MTEKMLQPPPPPMPCQTVSVKARQTPSLVFALLLALPLGWLWLRLINNLRLEWSTNPQYGYGWLVPLLCVGLLVRRALYRPTEPGTPESSEPFSARLFWWIAGFCALLYLPTRLMEGATPEWRPIQWAMGVIAIGLTLSLVRLGKGAGWMRLAAFPICFFLVAIPWPTLVETPVIQALARLNARFVVEIVGILGVPALQHGNVIEIGSGVVGIDDACSGIRSFQSSIMISFFLGEYYRLRLRRRALLIALGILLAIAFNICRTSFLTMVAAKEGVPAIARYHDPAGMTILLACVAATWLCAWLMERTNTASLKTAPASSAAVEGTAALSSPPAARLWLMGWPLLVWLVAVEAGVGCWYRVREARLPHSPAWSLILPESNPTFKATPVPPDTRNLLRYDEGQQASWREGDGTQWQAYYFNWHPGRVAGYLAKRHTPEICLPATGLTMRSGPELFLLDVHHVLLPIRQYVFGPPGNSVQVFHCRWEAGMTRQSFVEHESSRINLIRGVWTGRGNQGQKVLEFIITGTEDPAAARTTLVHYLEKAVKVE